MPRAVPEWIGKHPDQKVPPRVRLRVLERFDRTCYLSSRPIRDGDPWELEHIKPLILGGEHRESNMAPALVEPHKAKTAIEKKIKSKIARTAKRAAGIKKKSSLSHPYLKRRMDGTVIDKRTGKVVGGKDGGRA
jgi:5-methylcytosine-specific restriction endonuclease McrA